MEKERTFYVRLGQRLRQNREGRGVTQQVLADAVGKSPVAISQYEQGKRMLSLRDLVVIADLLHLPLPQLLPGPEGSPETVSLQPVQPSFTLVRALSSQVRRFHAFPKASEWTKLLAESFRFRLTLYWDVRPGTPNLGLGGYTIDKALLSALRPFISLRELTRAVQFQNKDGLFETLVTEGKPMTMPNDETFRSLLKSSLPAYEAILPLLLNTFGTSSWVIVPVCHNGDLKAIIVGNKDCPLSSDEQQALLLLPELMSLTMDLLIGRKFSPKGKHRPYPARTFVD